MSLIRDPARGTSQLYLYVLHEPQHSNSVFTFSLSHTQIGILWRYGRPLLLIIVDI